MYVGYRFLPISGSLVLGQQSKELQHILLVHRRRVSDPLSKVPNNITPIAVQNLGIRRARHASVVLRIRQPPDGAPLLQRLISGLRIYEVVGEAVPDLHARVASIVARVRVVHEGRPVGGRMRQAVRTRLVGPERRAGGAAGEARVRDAAVRRARGEHVRVRPGQDVGHHGARGAAHDEDAALVPRVGRQRVVDHADDAGRVAAAGVRQRPRVVHVPAVGVVRRARVHQDEAARVGVRGQLGARVPGRC